MCYGVSSYPTFSTVEIWTWQTDSQPEEPLSESLPAPVMEVKEKSQLPSYRLKLLLYFFSPSNNQHQLSPCALFMVSKRQCFDNRAGAHPIILANNITFSYYFVETILTGREKPRGHRNFKDFFFKLFHGWICDLELSHPIPAAGLFVARCHWPWCCQKGLATIHSKECEVKGNNV